MLLYSSTSLLLKDDCLTHALRVQILITVIILQFTGIFREQTQTGELQLFENT